MRLRDNPVAASPVRSLHAREGVGLTANVVQHGTLRVSQVCVDSPALILLTHGVKILCTGTREWMARAGDVLVVAGGQALDLTNRLGSDGLFEARWIVWAPALPEAACAAAPGARSLAGVAVLRDVSAGFREAIDRAAQAIADPSSVPEPVARHRLVELGLWLAESGVRLQAGRPPSLSAKLRAMFAGGLARDWATADVAGQLAMSEATMRRRLGAEGATFRGVLTDARMSSALTLLQATDRAVAQIASDVGYESASRFAARFRERFGFAPSAVRGHRQR